MVTHRAPLCGKRETNTWEGTCKAPFPLPLVHALPTKGVVVACVVGGVHRGCRVAWARGGGLARASLAAPSVHGLIPVCGVLRWFGASSYQAGKRHGAGTFTYKEGRVNTGAFGIGLAYAMRVQHMRVLCMCYRCVCYVCVADVCAMRVLQMRVPCVCYRCVCCACAMRIAGACRACRACRACAMCVRCVLHVSRGPCRPNQPWCTFAHRTP